MVFLSDSSPVSSVASVVEWGGPDSHCSDRNRENSGLPAPRIYPHGWTANVSTGPVKPFPPHFICFIGADFKIVPFCLSLGFFSSLCCLF